MAYDYGTQNIGGQNINLNQLVEHGGDMSKILELLGLPSTYGSKLGIPTLGSDVIKALDPNDPMYQQRITGLQQTAMPSLMQGALALGSGKSGGLQRSDRSFGTKQQTIMQPYLNQLTNVHSGISSDIGRAQGITSNWLGDVLGGYRDLDYSKPTEDNDIQNIGLGISDPNAIGDYIDKQLEDFDFGDFSLSFEGLGDPDNNFYSNSPDWIWNEQAQSWQFQPQG